MFLGVFPKENRCFWVFFLRKTGKNTGVFGSFRSAAPGLPPGGVLRQPGHAARLPARAAQGVGVPRGHRRLGSPVEAVSLEKSTKTLEKPTKNLEQLRKVPTKSLEKPRRTLEEAQKGEDWAFFWEVEGDGPFKRNWRSGSKRCHPQWGAEVMFPAFFGYPVFLTHSHLFAWFCLSCFLLLPFFGLIKWHFVMLFFYFF